MSEFLHLSGHMKGYGAKSRARPGHFQFLPLSTAVYRCLPRFASVFGGCCCTLKTVKIGSVSPLVWKHFHVINESKLSNYNSLFLTFISS